MVLSAKKAIAVVNLTEEDDVMHIVWHSQTLGLDCAESNPKAWLRWTSDVRG